MGFFGNIGKTLKGLYKKVDRAVGGYLPGGQTPQQSRQERSSSSSGSNIRSGGSSTTSSSRSSSSSSSSSRDREREREREREVIANRQPVRSDRELTVGPSVTRTATPAEMAEHERLIEIYNRTGNASPDFPNAPTLDEVRAEYNADERGEGIFGGDTIAQQIARVRSGDSFLGDSPLKLLGDPRTTIGLATILGGLKLGAGLLARGAAGAAGNTTLVAGRFASNPKTAVLTKGFLVKLGFSLTAAAFVKDMIGTYPFAGFIKEEALQTASFGYKSALESGDFEGAQRALDKRAELLNPNSWKQLIGWIPYANVQSNLNDYFEADLTTLANQQEALNRAIAGEANLFEIQNIQRREREAEARGVSGTGGTAGSDFLENQQRGFEAQREFDEERRATELQQRLEDSEFYKSITKGKSTSEKSTLTFGLLKTIEKIFREMQEGNVRG